ncbi:MAG: cofactor-independent phosphoglycerate mutase [Desulfonauticus sp.]|nr:cofactor-independent phosphoglycerate mutase [Desulfonauticus sp.]
MKIIFLIEDGLGDWPLEELNGKTPLEAARTPNLDRLAPYSLLGTCQTIPKGFPSGSDVANMALLGYAPEKYHTGRGPIEAAAKGILAQANDVIWRCNLVSVSEFGPKGKMLDYAAGHISSEQALKLINWLNQQLQDKEFKLTFGLQYRHLLIQPNAPHKILGLTPNPPHDILNQSIAKDLQIYQKYPPLFQFLTKAAQLLANNPIWPKANALWPWGQGTPLQLENFTQKTGLKGAVISAVDLIKGLGKAAGLEVIEVPGATGLTNTNYKGKVSAALKALKSKDFVFLHLEGPDEAGHCGDVKAKIKAIEFFDKLILAPILSQLKEPFTLAILCDHFTPIRLRTHVAEPVPFLIYRSNYKYKGFPQFCEKTAQNANLFIPRGDEFLNFVQEQAGA